MIVNNATGEITFTLYGGIGAATVPLKNIQGASVYGKSTLVFTRNPDSLVGYTALDVDLTRPEAARLLRLVASELEQEELESSEDAITADDVASAPFA